MIKSICTKLPSAMYFQVLITMSILIGSSTRLSAQKTKTYYGYWIVEPAASNFVTIDGKWYEINNNDMPKSAMRVMGKQPFIEVDGYGEAVMYCEVRGWPFPWHPDAKNPENTSYRLHVVRVIQMKPAPRGWRKQISHYGIGDNR